MAPALLLIVAVCHVLAAAWCADEGNWAMAIMLFAFAVGDGAMVYMAMQK
jgi:hypothetical protein